MSLFHFEVYYGFWIFIWNCLYPENLKWQWQFYSYDIKCYPRISFFSNRTNFSSKRLFNFEGLGLKLLRQWLIKRSPSLLLDQLSLLWVRHHIWQFEDLQGVSYQIELLWRPQRPPKNNFLIMIKASVYRIVASRSTSRLVTPPCYYLRLIQLVTWGVKNKSCPIELKKKLVM